MFFEKQSVRKNQTFGKGRRGIVAAIKACEKAAAEKPLLDGLLKVPDPESKLMPDFFSFSRIWFQAGRYRWAKFTIQRYESVLTLCIEPNLLFRKSLVTAASLKRRFSLLHSLYE